MSSIYSRLQNGILKSQNVSLQFLDKLPSEKEIELSKDFLPVILNEKSINCDFDIEEYKRHLATKVLGRALMYIEVVPSTLRLYDG